MDPNQIVIKIVLIVALALVAFTVIVPGRSARRQALSRIGWLLGLILGVAAIVFPHLTSQFANWLGIGRGTDLLLYILIVLFAGFAVTTAAHNRKMGRTLTVLARKFALIEAELRKTDVLRHAATRAHGNESLFDATGPIDLPPDAEQSTGDPDRIEENQA